MTEITLYALNLNYSSWSLRPRILMDYYKIPYKLQMFYKDIPESLKAAHEFSPTGKLPAVKLSGSEDVIFDSLAICELLQELYPFHPIYPTDPYERAFCRAIAAEMHSGFPSIRDQMGMNLSFTPKDMNLNFDWHPDTINDIKRIDEVWTTCRARVEDRFLFGHFTVADAMYVPVVTRLVTYGVTHLISPKSLEYLNAVLNTEVMKTAYAEAKVERQTHIITAYEIYNK
ncbi:glutathione S-transferase domain-containing protein [Globomyces pollinis-pini]|nr:glutathione S-transferase domain-containing protein [Globomyces pollinis-pini]